MVPQINSVGLKQRSLQLRHASRRGSSKIIWLKSGHYMLNRPCNTTKLGDLSSKRNTKILPFTL